jgi:hypothetical protein
MVPLALASLLAAIALGAWPATALALDLGLDCKGTSGFPQKFKAQITLKLDGGTFCIDGECHAFSSVSDKTLEYHCVTKAGGHFCRILGPTTAGPFISNDDVFIDRATWEIRRKSSGYVGDIASFPYSSFNEAKCTVMSIVATP